MKYKNKHSKKIGILIENTDDIKEPISQININCYNFKEAMLFKEYLENSPIFESSYVSKSVLLKENNAEKYKFDVIYKKCSKRTGIKNF